MRENNDIEQRAFWNLPASGIIIETHYGTESHACDAIDYFLQSKLHQQNDYTFLGIDFCAKNKRDFFYYGGIGSGKKFARQIQEAFGQRESPENFYKRVALMTGETFEEVKNRYENKTTEDNQA